MNAERCSYCGKSMSPPDKLFLLNRIWHKWCFKCTVCGGLLSQLTFASCYGLPYCAEHLPKAAPTTAVTTPKVSPTTSQGPTAQIMPLGSQIMPLGPQIIQPLQSVHEEANELEMMRKALAVGEEPVTGPQPLVRSNTQYGVPDTFGSALSPASQQRILSQLGPQDKLRTSQPSNAQKDSHIEELEWYTPLGRIEVEAILKNCLEDAFLIRPSSLQGYYALSMVYAKEALLVHYAIAKTNDGEYYLQKCPKDSAMYSSILYLVGNSPALNGFQSATRVKKRS